MERGANIWSKNLNGMSCTWDMHQREEPGLAKPGTIQKSSNHTDLFQDPMVSTHQDVVLFSGIGDWAKKVERPNMKNLLDILFAEVAGLAIFDSKRPWIIKYNRHIPQDPWDRYICLRLVDFYGFSCR